MSRAFPAVLVGAVLAATACLPACQIAPRQSLSVQAAAAPAQPAALKYLDPAAIERLIAVLPAPPADRGPISRGEGDFLLALQAQATPEAQQRAKAEDAFTLWTYADVLGPGFAKENLPLTQALFRQADRDSIGVIRAAKERWFRKRPPQQDDRITATLEVPANDSSYPSGHAVRAVMWARLLALLAPDQERALLERARLVAYHRVIAGLHYPSDVAAGMSLGAAIADELAKSPEFQADLAKAREEFKAAMAGR